MLSAVAARLVTESVAGKLWIVEPGLLRVYEPHPGS
jgi:hypothetical protein